MRRGLFLLLTWLAGTVVAIGLAWGAVSVVRHNVTDRRVAPLSARAVSQALEDSGPIDTSTTAGGDTSTTATTAVSTVTTITPLPGSGRTTTTRRTSGSGGSAPTTRGSTSGTTGGTTGGGGGGGGGTTGGGGSTGGGGGSNGSGGGSTSSPTTTAPQSQFTGERVVDDGNHNQVDVRCQNQTVSYGWITPASGWSYLVLQNGPTDLIVKFTRESPSSESRLEASCDAAGHPTFTWKH